MDQFVTYNAQVSRVHISIEETPWSRLPLGGKPHASAFTRNGDERRTAMLKLLEVAAGRAPFGEWAKHAEAMAPRKTEKLDALLSILYVLLEDLLLLTQGAGEIRNADIRAELEALARGVSFRWIRAAVHRADELSELVRRNIQKSIALDALVMELRALN